MSFAKYFEGQRAAALRDLHVLDASASDMAERQQRGKQGLRTALGFIKQSSESLKGEVMEQLKLLRVSEAESKELVSKGPTSKMR